MITAGMGIASYVDLEIHPIGEHTDQEILELINQNKVELSVPQPPYSVHDAWKVLKLKETGEQVAFVDNETSSEGSEYGNIEGAVIEEDE